MHKTKIAIPESVSLISAALIAAGFEAYLVGGCVRDMLLGREPKDWDVTTNAKPEEIMKIFPDSVYENDFGTVLVKVKSEMENGKGDEKEIPDSTVTHPPLPINRLEVTTYRVEGTYTDKRHPDEIKFAKTVEEDLSRRDFTINAMAMSSNQNTESGIQVVD